MSTPGLHWFIETRGSIAGRCCCGARYGLLLGAICLSIGLNGSALGADPKAGQEQLLAGNYAACLALARTALRAEPDHEQWQLLLSQALLATGQYPEASNAITQAMARDRDSIRLRWQARQVLLCNGQVGPANDLTEAILRLASYHPTDYRQAANLVVVGQAALAAHAADPKRVLDTIFDAARKLDPDSRDVYLASGDLALEKHDFALAAKRFQEGLKHLPNDPDLHYGLARAYAPSDEALTMSSLEAALGRNSNHVDSLLLLADHNLDAEDYPAATEFLDRIQAINPWHPEAWAYRAVLAHLENQPQTEETARTIGLKFWTNNPEVDYLIGLKLSQNYRFAEGAAHQRRALQFDPEYLPAKAQLAQDLLRLGDEAQGWKLVEEVQKQDAYDVEAYNLATLHQGMEKFATLTNQDFLVRISRHEAAVYGARVLDLLERARSTLSAKYGLEPKRPTTVEVFPEQKDFAVRTFGMPGNPGYLGVCFGSVVTANGPAARPGQNVNWQSVLWHEFCHVITLQKTRNKMPRWLSEGISVYEERQANPSWGEHLNPDYREMLLGDDLTPIAKLSGAFLAPRSALHLQFAYYESSLVVEFLVQRFGLEPLKAILSDLGEGAEVNHAIEQHTAPMATLEQEFAAFARQRAQSLAPGLDFEKPELAEQTEELGDAAASRRAQRNKAPTPAQPEDLAWQAWAKDRPTNFWVMNRQSQELVGAKQWPQAKTLLERLLALYPDFTGPQSAYRLLATVHHEMGETNAEREVLAHLAEKDDAAVDAYRRVMELAAAAEDWPAVALNAQRYLAVDPLVPLPYRFLAQAAEKIGQMPTAIEAYRSLLELDPPDPVEVHYQLARLLHRAGDPQARRHVLQALEEAPRYRAALRLLLEIEGDSPHTMNDGPGGALHLASAPSLAPNPNLNPNSTSPLSHPSPDASAQSNHPASRGVLKAEP